jgi:aminopeptidase C
LDYCFDDKIDVKLIALFIIDNFKMPVPNSFIVDTLALEPFVNYFDLRQQMGELEEEELVTYYIENNDRFYSLTQKGTQALEFFSLRIPKTVRERLLRTIKIKIKDLKNALSIKADYEKVNDIEYNVSLGISEGNFDMFNVSISVSDELMAKKMCAAFKNNPQSLYSEFLSILTKNI